MTRSLFVSRVVAVAILLLAGLILLPAVVLAADAPAATYADPAPFCAAVRTLDKPDARYTGPAVPDWVARALKKATHASAGAPLDFFKHAAWRCAGGHVLACTYGADIPCDSKADISRKPSAGAEAFCRERPDAVVVPAAATGQATVYAWRCRAGRPKIVRQVLKIDRRGFAVSFWHRVSPEMSAR